MSFVRSQLLRPKLLVWVCLGLVLAQLVPVLGPYMRETDQASLLTGAVRLADGRDSLAGVTYYSYDKQYVSYWVAAVAHRLAPRADLVTLCNVVGFSLFWGGVALLVLRSGLTGFAPAALVIVCLGAPTFWLHSPFYSTPFVSGGFLLLAWVTWARARALPAGWLVPVGLLFLAVGARADAVLVLPWLVWTVMPVRSLGRLLRTPVVLLVGLAGCVAFGLGRVLYAGFVIDSNAPLFAPKIYAAYTIFGLGAAALAFGWLVLALLRAARVRARRERRRAALWYLIGLAALLIPWAFYSFQLYSTRYWTLLLCAVLGGLLTRRGARLVAGPANWRRRLNLCAGAAVGLAVIPVFVGIRLPYPTEPRLVTQHPTLFPTVDGLQPMGALHWYFAELAARDGRIDHNHATWLSARDGELKPGADGRVPVLVFNLRAYLELAAALRGLSVDLVPASAPAFYADARDLLRTLPPGQTPLLSTGLDAAAALDVVPAGPEIDGRMIVRVDRDRAPRAEWLGRVALARAFGGNDFRLAPEYAGKPVILPPAFERGKTLVLFSSVPFAAEVPGANGAAARVEVARVSAGAWFIATVHGRTWDGAGVRILSGSPAVAVTIHPDYMGVDQFR
ncbi:MAG: hypothetical protein WDM96_11120 [Lacunisphaera sp.]